MFLNWSALLLEELCRKCKAPVSSNLKLKSKSLLTLCNSCRQFIEINYKSVAFLNLDSQLIPVLSATTYDNLTQRLIRRLKYNDDKIIARDMASMMFDTFDSIVLRQKLISCLESVIVTPVPLHKAKIKHRGYNQASLLALYFLKHSRLRLRSRFEELLVRRKETSPMFGLSRVERYQNVDMAFACKRFSLHYLHGKTIILVDDVFTSGATLKECARTLIDCGAESIIALTAARSL